VLLRMVVRIRMSIIGNIMSVESIDDNVGYIWTRYSNILISNTWHSTQDTTIVSFQRELAVQIFETVDSFCFDCIYKWADFTSLTLLWLDDHGKKIKIIYAVTHTC